MDELDDCSISSSPTLAKAAGCYTRSQRLQQRNKNKSHNVPAQPEGDINLELSIYEADRLDCLRAQQEPARERLVPASQNFISLQSLLADDKLPEDEIEHVASGELEQVPKSIVDQISQDFCSLEEEELPQFKYPWFRFSHIKIKTYARKRKISPEKQEITDEDDRVSCSSELSVQEDHTADVPTTSHFAFDSNVSQKICENLLNLSAFFSQNNANTSIDLPANVELPAVTIESRENDSDDLSDNTYNIGNTELCRLVDIECSNQTEARAELTLFRESTQTPTAKIINDVQLENDIKLFEAEKENHNVNLPRAIVPESCKEIKPERDGDNKPVFSDSDPLNGIVLSQWPLDDLESNANQTDVDSCIKIELELDENQLDMIFDEWEPLDSIDTATAAEPVQFRTASNKCIEISEEQQQQAVRLMLDLEASATQIFKETSENLEFRTASNKVVVLSQAVQKKAAILMADLELGADPAYVQETVHDDWNMFRTASNKTIKLTEEMKKSANNLLADLEYNNLEQPLAACEPVLVKDIPLSGSKVNASVQIELEPAKLEMEAVNKPNESCKNSSISEVKKTLLTEEFNTTSARGKEDNCLITATPKQRKVHLLRHSSYETPKCPQETSSSLLSLLSTKSPLQQEAKQSLVMRRNVLSMYKRRRLERHSDDSNLRSKDAETPLSQRCLLLADTMTTPVAIKTSPRKLLRDRSCSQDSPRIQPRPCRIEIQILWMITAYSALQWMRLVVNTSV
ncbi:breast cancer type 2 susceptibility protein homolog isoform X2 [Drosophila busckii]|uniref:breast cancer type 2 susceptibility protein homolog isoform X2 n=1 Tax=Drosophila busckii TaxID=30019 RepID=UPI00083EF0CB|nr:breast cancer type 2 susceptibility protein homolog isoform X2 [Drosophila busckii]